MLSDHLRADRLVVFSLPSVSDLVAPRMWSSALVVRESQLEGRGQRLARVLVALCSGHSGFLRSGAVEPSPVVLARLGGLQLHCLLLGAEPHEG